MKAIAEITIQSLRELGLAPLPGYESRLMAACEECPLTFGTRSYGDRFREMSMNRSWFIDSLASNTAKEADGAERIWEMASRTEDPTIREHLRKHAIDESRHARYYVAMIDLAFPNEISAKTRARLMAMVPSWTESDQIKMQDALTPHEATLDELIQMNIGEIRTRIHQLLLRPVISAYCPEDHVSRLTKLLDALLLDETRHVAYTAQLIDQAVAQGEGDWVLKIMLLRWAQFDEITRVEQESAVFCS